MAINSIATDLEKLSMNFLFTVFSRARSNKYQIKLNVPNPKQKCTFIFVTHLHRGFQMFQG